MSLILTILMSVLCVAVAVPMLVFILECLAAFWPIGPTNTDLDHAPRFAVLVPAHNEAAGITRTLEAIVPQLREQDRVVVVADNCRDDTARIARAFPSDRVHVVERNDAERHGKGYALGAGVDALRDDPPAVVIVIDADCRPDDGAVPNLAAAAARYDAPTQSVNLLVPPENAGVIEQIGAFAFLVKNLVRQRGMKNLGQPATLQGTGMAFPWAILEAAPLRTGHLVEDLVIGLKLLEAGHTPRFCTDARVTSPQATQAAATSQRTRWEHGYLSVILRWAPRLFAKALRGQPRLLSVALDLAVPPLSLLVMLYGVTTLASVLVDLVTGAAWLPLGMLALGVVFGATIALVCVVFGRPVIQPTTLLLVPLYALRKLPVYVKFVVNPQAIWVRTHRG